MKKPEDLKWTRINKSILFLEEGKNRFTIVKENDVFYLTVNKYPQCKDTLKICKSYTLDLINGKIKFVQ
jgi:hypothetical protein